jgi:plastocyanin
MKRFINLSIALGCAVLVFAVTPSAAALPKLVGTVGPGYTITLKKNGVRVTKLKPGRYTVVIRDRSNIHSFHLRGPALNRTLTSIGLVGTRSFTLRLRAGRYTYFCDPHPTEMRGSFRVG